MYVHALAPRAALLPESLETEFAVLGVTALTVLIVVVPVVAMAKDLRRGSADPTREALAEQSGADRDAA